MRGGVDACPSNWNNCAMWVQDPILSSMNITAEISKAEVDSFVRMCKIFAKHVPKIEIMCENLMSQSTPHISQNETLIPLIEKLINNTRFTSFLETRLKFKLKTTAILTKYVQEFDQSLEILPFGSSRFGIEYHNCNFNILITTSGYNRFRLLVFFFLIFDYIYKTSSNFRR